MIAALRRRAHNGNTGAAGGAAGASGPGTIGASAGPGTVAMAEAAAPGQASRGPLRKAARELATLVAECAASGAERSVFAVRLSLLPPSRRRPHHVLLARAALDPLTFADRANLFELDNHDLVVIWRGAATTAVDLCRRSLLHMFAEERVTEALIGQAFHADPEDRAAAFAAGPASAAHLLELLRLPADMRRVLAILEDSLPSAPMPSSVPAGELLPLDPATVAALEDQLRHADMAPFVRRRSVCAAASDGRLTLAWERRLLAVEVLVATLIPERTIDPDAWLFRRLTRTLDRRMLALLSDTEELRLAGPFSLDLNVSTILSPEFLHFDENLPARLRGDVVLGLLPADVVADPSAFLLAREFARVRGYVLLLRDVSAPALPVFSREEVGVDWLQLRWSPRLAAEPEALASVDPGYLVLSGVDTPAALAWARAQHVARFVGTAVHPN